METDDVKLAWQEMNRRLERQEQLIARQLQQAQARKVRHGLWPLYAGQLVQMAVGLGVILLGVAAWQPYHEVPHVLIAGIVVHIYGVLLIVLAGMMLGRMHAIDYAAPVAAIQQQLASLRVFYLRSGMIVGLSWWLLWVPFAIVLVAVLLGVDMYARAPLALDLSLLFGALGLLGTWLFRRWAWHPKRRGLGARLDDAAAGASLRRAKQAVDEIASFQREA